MVEQTNKQRTNYFSLEEIFLPFVLKELYSASVSTGSLEAAPFGPGDLN